MTCRVELVYDCHCPNVDEARAILRRALTQVGIPPAWVEWDRKAPDSPAYVRGYGSPTILVNGKDVAGAEPGTGADCCRVYSSDERGLRGIPPVEFIVAALRKNSAEQSTLQEVTS